MKKQSIILLLSVATTFGAQLAASAAPGAVDNESGVLGSPMMSAGDPQVRQAVEALKGSKSVTHYLSGSGVLHKNIDRTLILGGPDVVPM
jgi:hypothetical protein